MAANAPEPELASASAEAASARNDRPPVGPEAWARLSELLVREPDPDRLCDEVCRLLVDRFGFARALVATRSAEGDRLVTRAGYDPAVPAAVALALRKLFTIPLEPQGDGRYLVAAWCVLRDEQVHVPDASDFRFRPADTVQRPTLIRVFRTREYVLTPVRGPSGVLGLLAADRRGREPPIGPADLQVLRTVGDLLGVALEVREAAGIAEVGRRGAEPGSGEVSPYPGRERTGQELPELLDVLREGLLLVAPDGSVRYLNRAASSLLDVLPWDAVGRPVGTLLPAEPGRHGPAGGSAADDGDPFTWRFRTPKGRVVEAQTERLSVSALGLRGWRALFMVDVTDRVEEERARDEFLATLVHDLSAPLQSIVGFAELLLMGRAGELNETQRDFIARIEQSGWEVTSLVADIRTLAELETGRTRLELESVDPVLLVQEVFDGLREENGAVPVRWVNEIPPDLPAIRADRTHLAAGLRVLGRRAMEACRPGETVRVFGDVAPEKDWVRLHVCDSGRQADPETARSVLRRRALAGGRAARRSGLGLLLARAVAEAHGGQIWASASPQGGTVIVLALPAADGGT